MSDATSDRVTCGRVCPIFALAIGGTGVVLTVVSFVLFFTLGEGKERYTDLNAFLGWHAWLTLSVLPFAIVAACYRKVLLGALAFLLCVASWAVTFFLVANSFHGDRSTSILGGGPGAQQIAAGNSHRAIQQDRCWEFGCHSCIPEPVSGGCA